MRSLWLFSNLWNYEINSVFVRSKHKYEFPDTNCLKKRSLSRYYKTRDGRMFSFLLTGSLINLNVSLQRTCDSVCRRQDLLWTGWKRREGRQHTWLRYLCQMSKSTSWFRMLVYRKSARTHTYTNTHTNKVSGVCHFSHGSFLRRLSCSSIHRVSLKAVIAFIASRVTGSRLQTFPYTAVLLRQNGRFKRRTPTGHSYYTYGTSFCMFFTN